MKPTSRTPEPRGYRYRPIWIAIVMAIALFHPRGALPELRPLVREMLENLGAVNQIGEGVALENYEQVGRAALDLKRRAQRMKELDLTTLGMPANRDPQFDAYLTAQERSADAILEAVKTEDSQATLMGLQQLLKDGCLACHADFREGNRLLRPSVMFMTTFITAWKEINRGLSINDLPLVARSARELQSMARVLSWDQVIESTFGLEDAEERKEFQRHLVRLSTHAAQIEQASAEADIDRILQADRQMWSDGCVACHDQFR
jgi:cytochrome c556